MIPYDSMQSLIFGLEMPGRWDRASAAAECSALALVSRMTCLRSLRAGQPLGFHFQSQRDLRWYDKDAWS